MNNNLISVVVPVYKGEKFLPSLVQNIERQSYRNVELILVNDCSPDNSGFVMRELAITRPFIKCFDRNENGGMGPARNSGMKLASGDYIMLVDQDDSFSDKYLETMKYIIDKDLADIAICGIVSKTQFSNNVLKLFIDKEDKFYKLYSGQDVFNNLFALTDMELFISAGPWGKIFKKTLYDKTDIQFPSSMVYEDYIMNFKALSQAKSVACYNSELYYLNRKYTGSTSNVAIEKIFDNLHDVPKILTEFVKANNLSSEKLSAVLRVYFITLKNFCLTRTKTKIFRNDADRRISLYLKAFPDIEFSGNELFIYFQLLQFYLQSKNQRCLDFFVKFIEPFRAIINNWISCKNDKCDIFNDDQKYYLNKFSTVVLNSSNSGKYQSLWQIYSRKILRQLYRFSQLLGFGPDTLLLDKLTILLSGLFDEEYFKNNHPDLQNTERSNLDYFMNSGWKEFKNPNRWFNIQSFLNKYPKIRKKGINPVVAYELQGISEGIVF
jgi:glycosyltransferase involved in cell wall biosynthesis